MKIFVTGASGFVGGAFTSAAVKAGHSVVAMARSEKSAQTVAARGATPMRCELGRVSAEHLAGCDVIVHSAAFVEQWGSRADFYAGNVEGTVQLLRVARQAGVKRFIHISTEAVLLAGQHIYDADETYPYPRKTPYLYSETKGLAEQRVREENRDTLTTLVLRPRMVWGPGDNTILPAAVAMVQNGAFMWIDRGQARTSITHIDNLVHAILLSLTHGRGGEIYFVTDGAEMTMHEFLSRYLGTQGLTLPERSVPSWLANAMASGLEAVWKAVGAHKQPPLTRMAVMLMSRNCTLRIDKIRREMGYKPQIHPEQGLAEMPKM